MTIPLKNPNRILGWDQGCSGLIIGHEKLTGGYFLGYFKINGKNYLMILLKGKIFINLASAGEEVFKDVIRLLKNNKLYTKIPIKLLN